jgi:hypothetical protein
MNLIHVILTILLILGIVYVFIGYKEGFTLSPGKFPCEVENPILFGDYPVKDNARLTNNTYYINSKSKPYIPMSSFKQKTNNIKNWITPDNGSCSPAEFCGALYNKKFFDTIQNKAPNDELGVRVNYYISSN